MTLRHQRALARLRVAHAKQRLVDAGGRRISATLTAPESLALDVVMTDLPGLSQSAAIGVTLRLAAAAIERRRLSGAADAGTVNVPHQKQGDA